MNTKEAVAKLTRIYMEQQSLSEQEKEIKTEIKESGLDASILANVAKAIVNAKVDQLVEKSTTILEVIEEVR